MNKAVIISVQPKYCELIASGRKTIEVRKTAPKIDTPFKVYIYQTKKKWIYKLLKKLGLYQGKVIGEFVCDKIDTYVFGDMDIPTPAYDGDSTCWEFDDGYYITNGQLEQTCLTYEEICDYGKGKTLYGLHISNLVIYDKPKDLGEFRTTGHCFNFKNVECTKNIWGDYIFHYSQNSLCRACKNLDDLGDCRKTSHQLTRPPQSWCYVEPLEV